MNQSSIFILEEIFSLPDLQIIILALGSNNKSAFTVVNKLLEIMENDHSKCNFIMGFINKLLINDIIGQKLWFIYKNEAKLDIDNLINLNLEYYTKEFFNDKFENNKKSI